MEKDLIMIKYLIEITSADIYVEDLDSDFYEILSYQKYFIVTAPIGLAEEDLKQYLLDNTDILFDISESALVTTDDWHEVITDDFDISIIETAADLDKLLVTPKFVYGDKVEIHYTEPSTFGTVDEVEVDYSQQPQFQICYTIEFSNGAKDSFYEKWITKA